MSDYLYYKKFNFSHIFNSYDALSGFLVLKPWEGGFNNIRQSLELAVCYALLTNRKLVLPSKYKMYLLDGESDYSSFFNIKDIGVQTVSMDDFCYQKDIKPSYDEIYKISDTVDIQENDVINFEDTPVPLEFTKDDERNSSNSYDLFSNEEVLFLHKNMLGIWYQNIFTSFYRELNMLVAQHVRYRDDIFEIGDRLIKKIGDQTYYSMHIRRNDFQYKHLFISCEKICDNIRDIIPLGSKLYIATDHKDKSFFKELTSKYDVIFYGDISSVVHRSNDINWIPIFEQLICTRGIKFIGNDLSTLSSYIYRLRGYMDDISDKNYYINTQRFDKSRQVGFVNCNDYNGSWSREYKNAWDFFDNDIINGKISRIQQIKPQLIKSQLKKSQLKKRKLKKRKLQLKKRK